ncbi:hypothetical protein M0813_29886 [Anaeramoeba flamelloides]|uniref:Uncharacterized protein n=1 Tax=Anaeramoeba flamelloides TaxID=1746091 RepID=A0ABQ8XLT6_9EUKA|nr:hypothetical protein M0813_29886 [Anaeramoeba flamelloides]
MSLKQGTNLKTKISLLNNNSLTEYESCEEKYKKWEADNIYCESDSERLNELLYQENTTNSIIDFEEVDQEMKELEKDKLIIEKVNSRINELKEIFHEKEKKIDIHNDNIKMIPIVKPEEDQKSNGISLIKNKEQKGIVANTKLTDCKVEKIDFEKPTNKFSIPIELQQKSYMFQLSLKNNCITRDNFEQNLITVQKENARKENFVTSCDLEDKLTFDPELKINSSNENFSDTETEDYLISFSSPKKKIRTDKNSDSEINDFILELEDTSENIFDNQQSKYVSEIQQVHNPNLKNISHFDSPILMKNSNSIVSSNKKEVDFKKKKRNQIVLKNGKSKNKKKRKNKIQLKNSKKIQDLQKQLLKKKNTEIKFFQKIKFKVRLLSKRKPPEEIDIVLYPNNYLKLILNENKIKIKHLKQKNFSFQSRKLLFEIDKKVEEIEFYSQKECERFQKRVNFNSDKRKEIKKQFRKEDNNFSKNKHKSINLCNLKKSEKEMTLIQPNSSDNDESLFSDEIQKNKNQIKFCPSKLNSENHKRIKYIDKKENKNKVFQCIKEKEKYNENQTYWVHIISK